MLGKVFWLIPKIINKITFSLNGVDGTGVSTYGRVLLKKSKSATLKIGEGSVIRSHRRSNPAGGGQPNCIITVKNGASLEIGKNVGISNSTIYCKEKIVIEDNVLIGANCVIYDTDFHSIYLEHRLNQNTEIKHRPVTIKEGAWIGGHCIILKGVTIGERAVIGAGSVVTKDVPAGELWAGNPAAFRKKII